MVALLVGMAILAIFMSIAMPVWRQANQREKETELIWRGQQYDRAIQLFRKKFSAPGPPNVDILIEQRFLRKKYKDPITNADFELKPAGIMGGVPNMPPGVNRPQAGQMMSRPGVTPRENAANDQSQNVQQPKRAPGQLIGGVRSKSTAKSIRVLNGKTRYDQWEFAYVPYGTKAQGPGQQNGQQPATSPRPGVGATHPTPTPR
jgi:type II secretory pathway pseudopilin PulG